MAAIYEHDELLKGVYQGTLKISVDTERAARFMNSDAVPNSYRLLHDCLSGLAILSVPTAFAMMYSVHLAAGLAMLGGLLPLLLMAVLWADESYVIDHCIESEEFYFDACEQQIVDVVPSNSKFTQLASLIEKWRASRPTAVASAT